MPTQPRKTTRLALSLLLSLLGVSLLACSDGRIAQLEENTKKLKSEVADIRALQAEQTASLRQLSSDFRSLTGRVEEVQHVSTGKTQELEQTITKLKSRVPPPAGVPEDLLNEDDERIAPNSGPAADQYKQALQQIRTGDFDSAKETLGAFVAANPGTAFTDNALFWLGIVSQRLGKFDQSVTFFSDVFQKYPAEDFVAPALFYLADSLQKLGSKQDAVLTLQKLIDEHPDAPISAKARGVLAELQPPPAPARRRGR